MISCTSQNGISGSSSIGMVISGVGAATTRDKVWFIMGTGKVKTPLGQNPREKNQALEKTLPLMPYHKNEQKTPSFSSEICP